MTHLGSDWQEVAKILNDYPNIECYKTDFSYLHPEDLGQLVDRPHKKNNASSIWVDVILHNKDFACEALCNYYKFIYWMKPFDKEHYEFGLVAKPELYYRNRIAGLKQYFQKTPNSLWCPVLEENLFFSAFLGGEDSVITNKSPVLPQI